jgi:hypothetical protein
MNRAFFEPGRLTKSRLTNCRLMTRASTKRGSTKSRLTKRLSMNYCRPPESFITYYFNNAGRCLQALKGFANKGKTCMHNASRAQPCIIYIPLPTVFGFVCMYIQPNLADRQTQSILGLVLKSSVTS